MAYTIQSSLFGKSGFWSEWKSDGTVFTDLCKAKEKVQALACVWGEWVEAKFRIIDENGNRKYFQHKDSFDWFF